MWALCHPDTLVPPLYGYASIAVGASEEIFPSVGSRMTGVGYHYDSLRSASSYIFSDTLSTIHSATPFGRSRPSFIRSCLTSWTVISLS